MPRTAKPIIRKLDEDACKAILARNHVGRLAYSRGNQLELEPIHYVYADGWIYGRTSPGAKTEMTGPGWWPVVFEVDEAENLFRWRSVLVHGGFYTLPATQSSADIAHWRRAIELVGTLIPETLTDLDPVPHRRIVFGIAVDEVSGREATPAGAPARSEGRPEGAGRRGANAHGVAGHEASRPVALLGPQSALTQHVHSVLNAAGYRVLEAATPEDLIVIAKRAEPRVVVAETDVAGAWRRLLGSMDALATPIPVVLVGTAVLPIEGVTGVVAYAGNSEEPSFARRILDEVQYADPRSQPPVTIPSATPR